MTFFFVSAFQYLFSGERQRENDLVNEKKKCSSGKFEMFSILHVGLKRVGKYALGGGGVGNCHIARGD